MSLLDALLLDPAPFSVFIANRTDSIKGSGTLSDPFDGSTQARFDTAMRSLPVNARVHLGPGTFETNGYYDGAADDYGWRLQSGMKIVGSGRGATTLRLVGVTDSVGDPRFYAIGHALQKSVTGPPAATIPDPADNAEVSDLTIDCHQPATGSLACGAIRVMGSHVRIRNVKVIGWGNKLGLETPSYVISLVTAITEPSVLETLDSGIEDCICTEPADDSNAPIHVLHAGAPGPPASNAEALGRRPFIRDCFVDGGSSIPSFEIRALSLGLCRGGLAEGNNVSNVRVGGPYLDNASAKDVIVRQNFYSNVNFGPYLKGGTQFSAVTLSSLARDGSDATNKTALATTPSAHGLKVGDRVKMVPLGTNPGIEYHGVFLVATIIPDDPTSTQFTYQSENSLPASGTAAMQKVFSAARIIIERNQLELATDAVGLDGIYIHDNNETNPWKQAPDYVHGDVFLQDNRLRYVDGAVPTDTTAMFSVVKGVKNLIVRNNVVEVANPTPLRNARCGNATYSNNRTPSGKLIQGYEVDSGTKYGELETDAEDAFILGFIEHR